MTNLTRPKKTTCRATTYPKPEVATDEGGDLRGRMTVYPYGYQRPEQGAGMGMGTMLTWDEMMTKKTVYNLHPEVRRRFHALIERPPRRRPARLAAPVGGSSRTRRRPDSPQPGNSWHESCPVSPQSPRRRSPIDTVPNISWSWMEEHSGSFGFRTSATSTSRGTSNRQSSRRPAVSPPSCRPCRRGICQANWRVNWQPRDEILAGIDAVENKVDALAAEFDTFREREFKRDQEERQRDREEAAEWRAAVSAVLESLG